MGSGTPSGSGKASPSELLLEVSSPCTSKPGDLDWPAAVAGEGQTVPIVAANLVSEDHSELTSSQHGARLTSAAVVGAHTANLRVPVMCSGMQHLQ